MTTLHLVRHGQSEWNLTGRLQGQVAHVGLTALGRAQAQTAAAALTRADALYSSDLRRALQTAEPVAAALGLAVRPEPGLRERGYGTFEGALSADVLAATADVDWTDPDTRIGGGESLREVFARIGATLTAIAAAHPGGTVVAVTHGDTIRAAAAWAAGLPPDAMPWREVANGSVTTVDVVAVPGATQRLR